MVPKLPSGCSVRSWFGGAARALIPARWRALFAGDGGVLAPESGEVLKVNDGGVLAYGDVEEANLATDVADRLLPESPSDDQIARYNSATSTWEAENLPAGQGGGLASVETDATISGDGSSGSPLGVANPFTDADERKLDAIAAGAEVNVNADWDSTSGDSQILNKPDLAEEARDAVGAALRAGTNIDSIDVDDATNTITINASTQAGQGGGGLTAEQVRDTIAASMRGTLPVTVTHNDSANTITIAINAATTTAAGSMSATDKAKLDGLILDPDYSGGTDGTTGTRKVRLSAANVATIVAEAQTQSDWTQTTTTNPAYIQNKPDIAEVARDAIGAALIGGTDISVTPNDSANTITIAFTGSSGGLDVEAVRDAVAAFIVATSPLAAVHADGANTLTLSIADATTSASGAMSSTDKTKLDSLVARTNADIEELARDAIGAAISSSAPISVSHNDATNSITISISAATRTQAGTMSGADKTKLDGIATGAEVNVQSDWNAASGDTAILNKPSLVTTFRGLTDTPSAYTGQGGKLVGVNTGATALEFVDAPSGGGGEVSGLEEWTGSPGSVTMANDNDFFQTGITIPSDGEVGVIFIEGLGTSLVDLSELRAVTVSTAPSPNTPRGVGNAISVTTVQHSASFSPQTNSFGRTSSNELLIAGGPHTAREVQAWTLSGAGGGGAADFTGLTDTPSAYTGQAGKLVSVNSGATALEFTNPSSGGDVNFSIEPVPGTPTSSFTFTDPGWYQDTGITIPSGRFAIFTWHADIHPVLIFLDDIRSLNAVTMDRRPGRLTRINTSNTRIAIKSFSEAINEPLSSNTRGDNYGIPIGRTERGTLFVGRAGSNRYNELDPVVIRMWTFGVDVSQGPNAHSETRYLAISTTPTITDTALTTGANSSSATTATFNLPANPTGVTDTTRVYLWAAVPESTGDISGLQQAGGSLGLITNLTKQTNRTLNSTDYKVYRTTATWPGEIRGHQLTIEQV